MCDIAIPGSVLLRALLEERGPHLEVVAEGSDMDGHLLDLFRDQRDELRARAATPMPPGQRPASWDGTVEALHRDGPR